MSAATAISTTLLASVGEQGGGHAGVQQPPPQTFYAIEERLQALLDTEEMVPEEQAGEYFADLAHAHADAQAKRAGIIRALVAMDERVEGAQAEMAEIEDSIKRKCAAEMRELVRLGAHIERTKRERERLEGYVLSVLRTLPKGRRKLQCALGTLSMQQASCVHVSDMTSLPWNLVRAKIEVLGTMATRIFNAMPEVVEFAKIEPDKTSIGAILRGGGEVPGAELVPGKETLRLS